MYNAMDIPPVTQQLIIGSKINLCEKEERAGAAASCFRKKKPKMISYRLVLIAVISCRLIGVI